MFLPLRTIPQPFCLAKQTSCVTRVICALKGAAYELEETFKLDAGTFEIIDFQSTVWRAGSCTIANMFQGFRSIRKPYPDSVEIQ